VRREEIGGFVSASVNVDGEVRLRGGGAHPAGGLAAVESLAENVIWNFVRGFCERWEF